MAGEHEPDGITESVEDLLRAGMPLGTRLAELERRTPITDEQLARYDRQLARRRGQLDAGDTAAQHPERHQQLQQRRAEIDELRELIAEERSRTKHSPEQRRAGELRELGDVT